MVKEQNKTLEELYERKMEPATEVGRKKIARIRKKKS